VFVVAERRQRRADELEHLALAARERVAVRHVADVALFVGLRCYYWFGACVRCVCVCV
jgi:hypothetical protein